MPIAKRNKRAKQCTDDLLSNLPDDLLHHILSFDDTKFAVRTSVLSKRFINLWKTLPDLNFDSLNFNRAFSFKKFVLDVLYLRDQSINIGKFSITRRGRIDKCFMNKVIDYLVSHNVKELIFRVDWGDFVLPQKLIACQLVHSLEMETFHPEMLPAKWFGFVGLRDLRLSKCSFHYESEDPFDPFSSCPNLKSLHISECYLGGFRVFKISGPQLVELIISDFIVANRGSTEVIAPGLTSFSFTNSLPQSFSLVELPALRDVSVQVFLPYEFFRSNSTKETAAHELINMLRVLRHAKSLTLSYGTIEILSKSPHRLQHQPSPFMELRKLKLKMPYGENSIMIPAHVTTYLLSASAYAATLEVEEQSGEPEQRWQLLKLLRRRRRRIRYF